MADSMTHKYIPRIEQKQENLFIEEYYSSTDTKIFMDDEEQLEISYINYSLQEQLKPIYGYASRTFDDIAIGSRLVNGVFKVPIKNIEAQTQLETIIKVGDPNTDDYNSNQDDAANSLEWLTPEDDLHNPVFNLSDEKFFEYKIKLSKLGYNIESGADKDSFAEQIKKFQEDNGEYPDGQFTEFTKAKIDEQILKTDLTVIYLKSGDIIYFEPDSGGPCIQLPSKQKGYVLESYKNGWQYVILEDETKGYILKGGQL